MIIERFRNGATVYYHYIEGEELPIVTGDEIEVLYEKGRQEAIKEMGKYLEMAYRSGYNKGREDAIKGWNYEMSHM